MTQIIKIWWNVLLKKEYIILDTKKIKVICINVNHRTLQLFSSWNNPNQHSREELSFYDFECDNNLHIKLPRWYKYIWVSYDKYDIVLTLLREDINQFRN